MINNTIGEIMHKVVIPTKINKTTLRKGFVISSATATQYPLIALNIAGKIPTKSPIPKQTKSKIIADIARNTIQATKSMPSIISINITPYFFLEPNNISQKLL